MVARNADPRARGPGPVQPSRKEGADDRITDLEVRLLHQTAQRRADVDNLARAVGHRDATIGRDDLAHHHRVVVVVQRAGVDPHHDFPRARRAPLGRADLQVLEAGGLT